MHESGLALLLIILSLILLVYFLPSLLAQDNKHKQLGSLFVINIFLGWMLIPWVLCLAWAVSQNNNENLENKEVLSNG